MQSHCNTTSGHPASSQLKQVPSNQIPDKRARSRTITGHARGGDTTRSGLGSDSQGRTTAEQTQSSSVTWVSVWIENETKRWRVLLDERSLLIAEGKTPGWSPEAAYESL